MKKTFILFFLLIAGHAIQAQKPSLTVYDPTCEYKIAPIGMDVSSPRLSWKLKSSLKDTRQEAYEIRVQENFPSRKDN